MSRVAAGAAVLGLLAFLPAGCSNQPPDPSYCGVAQTGYKNSLAEANQRLGQYSACLGRSTGGADCARPQMTTVCAANNRNSATRTACHAATSSGLAVPCSQLGMVVTSPSGQCSTTPSSASTQERRPPLAGVVGA